MSSLGLRQRGERRHPGRIRLARPGHERDLVHAGVGVLGQPARIACSAPASDTCPTISGGIAASSSAGCGPVRAKRTTSAKPASANISPYPGADMYATSPRRSCSIPAALGSTLAATQAATGGTGLPAARHSSCSICTRRAADFGVTRLITIRSACRAATLTAPGPNAAMVSGVAGARVRSR